MAAYRVTSGSFSTNIQVGSRHITFGTKGQGCLGQSPEMLLLSWQLVASIDSSPLTREGGGLACARGGGGGFEPLSRTVPPLLGSCDGDPRRADGEVGGVLRYSNTYHLK